MAIFIGMRCSIAGKHIALGILAELGLEGLEQLREVIGEASLVVDLWGHLDVALIG